MTQYGDLAFFWDAENRLLGVASNGIALVTNRYDYMSRRIEKGSAGGTNAFLYDGWNLIRENTTSSPVAVEIANPDFADGLDGWTSSNVEDSTCGPQTVAKFTTSGAWLEQDIGAVAGDEYLVTFRYHPSGCGGAPGYGSYPWNIAVSIGDATASTNGSYAPWATWNGMSNFTFRLRPSTPAPLRIAVGGMPNPVVTHVSVTHIHHTSNSCVWGLDLSETLQGAGGVGGLLIQHLADTNVRYFSFCDANGNIVNLTDEYDVLSTHYQYDGFGFSVFHAGFDTGFNSFCYGSKYFDNVIRLYYYGYRYYFPEIGRWSNRDPIEHLGGFNLYGFVKNNPVANIDKFGLEVVKPDSNGKCPKRCCEKGGVPEQLVPIWICTRMLGGTGPGWPIVNHQYICCGGQNVNCFGVQKYRPSCMANCKAQKKTDKECEKECYAKKGTLIEPETSPTGTCEIRCITDSEKNTVCNGQQRMPEDYHIGPFGIDCQEWADDSTTTRCEKK